MASIEVTYDPQNDLTVFSLKGKTSVDEIIEKARDAYYNKPTQLVLWDGTGGSVSHNTYDDFERIAKELKHFMGKRKRGRTALVGVLDAEFGMGRMYEAFAEAEGLPIEYKTFKSIEKAKKWLGLSD